MAEERETRPQVNRKAFIRNLVIELIIYGGLVTLYYFLALRLLAKPLNNLFHSNPLLYALAAVGLIVGQGVALESLTSYLLERLGLQRFE